MWWGHRHKGKSNMKYQIKISRGKIVGLAVIVAFIVILAYNSRHRNPALDFTSSNKAPTEYWDLFKDTFRNNFKVLNTVTMRFQNPVSDFKSHDNKYFVEVFKLKASSNVSLNNLVSQSTNDKIDINGITYLTMGCNLYTLFYKMDNNKATHIDVSINGFDTKVLRNDSVALFSSKFKVFYIRYNNSDTTSIWAMSDGKSFIAPTPHVPAIGLPIDIMFIKKQKAIYLLLMSVNDPRTKFEPDQLSRMIRTGLGR
jgi:hypothetical protein